MAYQKEQAKPVPRCGVCGRALRAELSLAQGICGGNLWALLSGIRPISGWSRPWACGEAAISLFPLGSAPGRDLCSSLHQ